MKFTVTYRGADGAVHTEAVEAASRGECFARMKARGIAPMSVKEGNFVSRRGRSGRGDEERGNREEETGKRDPTSPRLRRTRRGRGGAGIQLFPITYYLFPAIVAIAAIAWWWIRSPRTATLPEPEAPKKAVLVKEVKPAKAPEPLPETEPAATPSPAPRRESLRDPTLSPEKREELYVKKLDETPIPEASTNRLFRTALEQVMGWVFTTQLGDMPPPLPPIPDYDLVHLEEILNLKNTARDTDTDRQANEKDIVDYVKKELKAFIDKGGDPEDFLKYYHDELKSAYAERSMAQEQVMKIMQEDPSVAMEYMKEVNESLAAKGIKGVVLPERTLKRMGIDPKLLKGDNDQ